MIKNFFYLFCFIVLILPSGSIGNLNFNIKTITLILLFALVSNKIRIKSNYIILIAISTFLVLLNYFVSILDSVPIDLFMKQLKDILITISIPVTYLILLKNNFVTNKGVLVVIEYSLCFLAAIKIFITYYSYISGLSIVQIMENIGIIFNTSIITYQISEDFGRIQFISDFLIPNIIFYILVTKKNNLSKAFILIILLISVFMSFSRYLYIYTIIIIGLSVVVKEKFNLNRFLLYFILLFGALYYFLIDYISLRFNESVSESSDIERFDQFHYLLNWIGSSPLLGHGLGSHVPNFTRSDLLPYSYEMQFVALIGQVGLIGIISLLGLLAVFYKNSLSNNNLIVTPILILFILSSFFNPTLFSSQSSLFYLGFYALLAIYRKDMKYEG